MNVPLRDVQLHRRPLTQHTFQHPDWSVTVQAEDPDTLAMLVRRMKAAYDIPVGGTTLRGPVIFAGLPGEELIQELVA
jgi:hypothetical protein